MNKTKIEWVKNPDGSQGFTWNPITGCLNHIDGLCKGGGFPCYAYKLANGRLRQRYLANDNLAGGYRLARGVLNERAISPKFNPFYPRFWPERLYIPFNGKPEGIFTVDMGELFGDWIPREWQEDIFRIIKLHPNDRFYLLTKQPQNLIKFSPFPDNCWVGVTATQTAYLSGALERLRFIDAKVRFISFEPLLERMSGYHGYDFGYLLEDSGIDWVIIGAQTKPYKPPEIAWVQEIHDAADKAGIPIFLKDNLSPLFKDKMGYLNKGWLRQEVPK